MKETQAQLFVCGHTFTYIADESGSVRHDWPKRTLRITNRETGEVIERPPADSQARGDE